MKRWHWIASRTYPAASIPYNSGLEIPGAGRAGGAGEPACGRLAVCLMARVTGGGRERGDSGEATQGDPRRACEESVVDIDTASLGAGGPFGGSAARLHAGRESPLM